MNVRNEDALDPKTKALLLYIGKLFLLFAAAFLAGHFTARLQEHFTQKTALETIAQSHVAEASEGNWGLSFQQDGQPPVVNASAEELKKYNAYYADIDRKSVV